MKDDLEKLEHVSGNMYNFHPGSHVGQGVDEGIRLIIEALNEILKVEQSTMVLLETMAGKGNEVGCSFDQLSYIVDNIFYRCTSAEG